MVNRFDGDSRVFGRRESTITRWYSSRIGGKKGKKLGSDKKQEDRDGSFLFFPFLLLLWSFWEGAYCLKLLIIKYLG